MVDCHQGGRFGVAGVDIIGQAAELSDVAYVSSKQHDAADAVFANESLALVVEIKAGDPHHHKGAGVGSVRFAHSGWDPRPSLLIVESRPSDGKGRIGAAQAGILAPFVFEGYQGPPMPGRYIVVEGPIAVGKTSLALRLAEALGARTVLEEAEENPFLRRFYDNPVRHAFSAQIFFLLNRFQQQAELEQLELFEQSVVSDYLFAKDRIFARLNLDDDELALYQQIYRMLDARIVRPDLVVYLEARGEVLWKRLRQRDRDFEKRVAPVYLERVAEAYRQYFYHYNDSPLLVVQSSGIDFVDNDEYFQDLLREIDTVRHGVQHYVPLR